MPSGVAALRMPSASNDDLGLQDVLVSVMVILAIRASAPKSIAEQAR